MQLQKPLQAHGLEYHADARVLVIQRGVSVIKKINSVAFTAIEMTMITGICQAWLPEQK